MPSRRTIQLAVPLRPLITGVKSSREHHLRSRRPRAVGIGLAMARFLGTSSPKIIDSEVAITSASDQRDAAAPVAGHARARRDRRDEPRQHGFGEVAGDQRGDRDAQLRAGQLERQRPVGVCTTWRGGRRCARWRRRCCVPARSARIRPRRRARCLRSAAMKPSRLRMVRYDDAHRRPRRRVRRACVPGRLVEGSASAGSSPGSLTDPDLVAPRRVPAAQWSLSAYRRMQSEPMLAVLVIVSDGPRSTHQPEGSGRPSANPAADCTPRTAFSCSSASVRAPA